MEPCDVGNPEWALNNTIHALAALPTTVSRAERLTPKTSNGPERVPIRFDARTEGSAFEYFNLRIVNMMTMGSVVS